MRRHTRSRALQRLKNRRLPHPHTPDTQLEARLHLLSLEGKRGYLYKTPHLRGTVQDPQHPDVERG